MMLEYRLEMGRRGRSKARPH